MGIDQLVEIGVKETSRDAITFTTKTQLWCQLPYPNHPKGCPNYNNKETCPPKARYKPEILDHYSNFFLIYANFNIKKQKERMLEIHPNWSQKQASCLLYWQNSVKKKLRDFINEIYRRNKKKRIYILSCGSGFNSMDFNQDLVYSMEAIGIDVLNTLRNNSIDFEVKPIEKAILTTLLCSIEPLLIEKDDLLSHA
ncbi:hypothetical protein LCGC14_0956210 [marine sediment metagenome]|uniref:DUF2284 domain-containing protein n=1 Tax=marine sediment metagenome TaxID=412755 RepID=A0A0F9NFR0_9ZZZZ